MCAIVAKLQPAGRKGAKSPRACPDGTVERHRFLCSYFQANAHYLTAVPHADVGSARNTLGARSLRVLHIAPEAALARSLGLANNSAIDYVTGDFFVTPTATNHVFVEHTIDVQSILFPERHFDVIIILHVLEHVPHMHAALSELFRVLRPGGLAVLAVPDARKNPTTQEADESMSAGERLKRFGQVDHFRRVGRDFEQILESHGFAVERIEIGAWYEKHQPQISGRFSNEEYDSRGTNRRGTSELARASHDFYYRELMFMATRPGD